MRARSEQRITYAAVLGLAVLIMSAPAVAAWLSSRGDSQSVTAASYIYLAYGRVCHQIFNRAFQLDGYPFAVCSRCFGIYAGYVLGLTIYPFVRSLARIDTPARLWLLLSLAPVAIDFSGDYVGLFHNTLLSRALTGSVAGAAGAFYTLPGLVSLAGMSLRTFRGDKQAVSQDFS